MALRPQAVYPTGAAPARTAAAAPGWNSFDIFDVTGAYHIHRISLMTRPAERRAVIGWLWPPSPR